MSGSKKKKKKKKKLFAFHSSSQNWVKEAREHKSSPISLLAHEFEKNLEEESTMG
jgi:hypothetical protein